MAKQVKNKTNSKATNWSINDFQVEPITGKTRFHDLDLHENIMRALHKLNFPYCTPIQEQILAHTLKGKDAIGRAQTGTGKTAAFLITIIQQLLLNPPPTKRYIGEPRAIIIAPTRELISQIAKDAENLAKFSQLEIKTLIGGADALKQQKHLEKSVCDILIATPGRLLDFCKQQLIYLDLVEILVLDEADRMLDMGFIPQVKQIINQTPHPNQRQTLMFSATFSDDILNLAQSWLHQPITIEIESETVASDNVTQLVYTLSSVDKYRFLRNLLRANNWQRVIIFANRKDQVRDIEQALVNDKFNVEQMSGDVAQNKRTQVLNKFRSGKTNILVATDVAGRGIHIDDVDCVINYNLPEIASDYVHRIGRTGRAGANGTSISLADEDCVFALGAIESLLGHKITCELPPENLLT